MNDELIIDDFIKPLIEAVKELIKDEEADD